MASNKVIVFGPTGNIASVTATTAQQHGAKVYLAMRDPKKAISSLSAEEEKSGGYERLQADLTKPDTVTFAVKQSGAKSAFIYLAVESQDSMKSTLQALKDSGVEFVVFLSSYTIRGPLKDIPKEDIIPFMHAQVELNLEEVFGGRNYVAVRPGGFATNVLWWKKGLVRGEVEIHCPDAKFDYITPVDMGRVSGTVLANGRQPDGGKNIYLFGPDMTSQGDAVATIARATGKDIKAKSADRERSVEVYKDMGMPEMLAKYLSARIEDVEKENVAQSHPDLYKEGVANIQKYGGKAPTTFNDWAEANKRLFTD